MTIQVSKSNIDKTYINDQNYKNFRRDWGENLMSTCKTHTIDPSGRLWTNDLKGSAYIVLNHEPGFNYLPTPFQFAFNGSTAPTFNGQFINSIGSGLAVTGINKSANERVFATSWSMSIKSSSGSPFIVSDKDLFTFETTLERRYTYYFAVENLTTSPVVDLKIRLKKFSDDSVVVDFGDPVEQAITIPGRSQSGFSLNVALDRDTKYYFEWETTSTTLVHISAGYLFVESSKNVTRSLGSGKFYPPNTGGSIHYTHTSGGNYSLDENEDYVLIEMTDADLTDKYFNGAEIDESRPVPFHDASQGRFFTPHIDGAEVMFNISADVRITTQWDSLCLCVVDPTTNSIIDSVDFGDRTPGLDVNPIWSKNSKWIHTKRTTLRTTAGYELRLYRFRDNGVLTIPKDSIKLSITHRGKDALLR